VIYIYFAVHRQKISGDRRYYVKAELLSRRVTGAFSVIADEGAPYKLWWTRQRRMPRDGARTCFVSSVGAWGLLVL